MTKALLPLVALCAALACAAPAQKPAAQPQAGASKTKNDGAKPPNKNDGAKPPNKNDGAKSSNVAAPPKITEVDEDGLKSLLGPGTERARPLLVNFWATWCAPCREEFPDLVKIREQYAADKLDFVIVSLDDPSDIQKAVPEFLTEVRATVFPAYLLHAADDNNAINLVDPTWSGELPATFLYDRSGALVFKHKGRIKVPELRAALDQALASKPAEAGTN